MNLIRLIMNRQELDRLLDLYYDGKSSDKEEQDLIAMVRDSNLPEEYYSERDMLLTLSGKADEIPEPDNGFESRIMQAIDDSEQSVRITSLKRRVYTAVSIAASFLILISSVFILNRNSEPADTFDDPLMAYNATVDLLQQVSSTLNSGSEAIGDLALIAETRDKINMLSAPAIKASKDMESLKYLEKSLSILSRGGILNSKD